MAILYSHSLSHPAERGSDVPISANPHRVSSQHCLSKPAGVTWNMLNPAFSGATAALK